MVKHESMKLVTFRTEESTEESKKSMEESKNGGREKARTLVQWASKYAELGLREEEGDGQDIKGGPLVPVGGSNRD